MDPISAIGLIASLGQLITTSNEVIDLIKSLRDTEKEIAALHGSVSLFEENLKGYDRVLRSGNVTHSFSAEIIDNAIKESENLMKEAADRLRSINKCESSTVRRLKWAQQRSKFEKIAKDLEGRCTMLHSLVSVTQM